MAISINHNILKVNKPLHKEVYYAIIMKIFFKAYKSLSLKGKTGK